VALKSLCRDFSQLGIRADFVQESCSHTISQSASLCLYRVVQEALHNVAKHSKANHARVSLRGSAREVEITVEDQGIGFDPSVVRTKSGLGLASIEERVRKAGGRCFIRSAPGLGTEVRAEFYTFILVE
jgi:signal transduction histidine kinase